jgi:hypothetical protein
MEWHINDLSVSGQFHDSHSVRAAIEPILRLRVTRPDLKTRIFCSKQLYLRPATETENLMRAISSVPDRNFRQLALQWFASAGPFWDDNRVQNSDDLFHFNDIDVTDQGLGEAARRKLVQIDARTYSFLGASEEVCQSPLLVTHGLLEEILHELQITNVSRIGEIEAEPISAPTSWHDLVHQSSMRFGALILSREIASQLQPSPFHAGIASRILDLLGILQHIAFHFEEDGSLDHRGQELVQMHFVGEKASFTDESDGNKRDFRHEMTFRDPSNPDALLFCPWHGKVKIGQFRIHFEWPRPKEQREVKVLYIGPKITKR